MGYIQCDAIRWVTYTVWCNQMGYIYSVMQSDGLHIQCDVIRWVTYTVWCNQMGYIYSVMQSDGLHIQCDAIRWLTYTVWCNQMGLGVDVAFGSLNMAYRDEDSISHQKGSNIY